MLNNDLETASLERIVPDELTSGEATGSETLRLHLDRYRYASSNLVPGTLLDMACGVGYGTALLATNPVTTRALGVDISSASVEYARTRYKSVNVTFLCADAINFCSETRFANIVSLETIEHVDEPQRLFAHLVSLLNPGGRLIASVPITPSVDANPHHKSNFTATRFRRMGAQHHLRYLDSMLQVQKFNPIAVARRREARSVDLRHNLPLFYFRNPSHLALRLWSTIRDGFVNKYLTVVWER